MQFESYPSQQYIQMYIPVNVHSNSRPEIMTICLNDMIKTICMLFFKDKNQKTFSTISIPISEYKEHTMML